MDDRGTGGARGRGARGLESATPDTVRANDVLPRCRLQVCRSKRMKPQSSRPTAAGCCSSDTTPPGGNCSTRLRLTWPARRSRWHTPTAPRCRSGHRTANRSDSLDKASSRRLTSRRDKSDARRRRGGPRRHLEPGRHHSVRATCWYRFVSHFRGGRPAHASEDREWRRLVPFIPAGRPAFSVLHGGADSARGRCRVCRLARFEYRRSGWSPLDRARFLPRPDICFFGGKGRCWPRRSTKPLSEVRGNPVSVANAVGLNPVTNQGLFSVSDSGTLVFFAGAVGESELVWFDRAGRRVGNPGPKGVFNSMSLSPDATSVVYDQAEPRNRTFDLWRLDFARGIPSRLTFHPSHDLFPLWSPDRTLVSRSPLLREPPPQSVPAECEQRRDREASSQDERPENSIGVVQRREVALLRRHRSAERRRYLGAAPGRRARTVSGCTVADEHYRHTLARRTVAGVHLERDRCLRGVRRIVSSDRIQTASVDAGRLRAALAA